jgi:2-succinyl-6-hydroxy-2,4-cyclohexadiene-1-carboxylate synthase
MKISFKGYNLSCQQIINNYKNTKALIFLHGFTGSSKDWEEITNKVSKNFNFYLLDFIGHGESSSPDDLEFYNVESIIKQIHELIKILNEKKIFLFGYSMGGRAALNFANKHQNLLSGLIIESTSPGISENSLREERISNDKLLAEFIKSHPLEEFVDYWMNLDLFRTQKNLPQNKLIEIKYEKLKNNKTGLVNSLIGFGSGTMPPLHSNLQNIIIKTLLITGEFDKKYIEINSKMKNLFQNAEHIIIKNAGHNTHLENPTEFTDELNKFLSGY